jgi:hypothetical protein
MKAGGFALRVHVGGGRRSERQQGQLWANAMNSLLQNKKPKVHIDEPNRKCQEQQ